ncbi:orotate phosphoribosyltransferase [Selenomonas sputigena]|uniref:Orotate phosphoribosyltransferase n=1 Tax=Selenomonas sputigena (strain ATCC 35185 / DSM 20758 / CCUG 44933 / VPI D19B-28) TaxID=546271 RepID=C9LS43_SELS3|nr:orotate phosphoribosyltransferase [Selenomonas sputigena]AEB99917.1 orotate phosphoribosyltransferase [Selenomonas sputigena ATCC 35185]EEX78322.1 orotate phosphoribosyltransferase [Selenomonas sputigena ATCC 35185]
MTEAEVKDLLTKTNAIMHGHFLLTSGLHSPHYVEKFNVLQHPEYTELLCRAMAEKFKDQDIDTVVGPVTGGILLAHETGKALGTRAIFTERENGKMTFRRGFSLKKGERVLIVEDIVTTGGSIKEVIDVVREFEGIPVAVAMLVDRSNGKVQFDGVPCTALLHMDVEAYTPEECPLCKEGTPLTKRGRTGK